MASRPRDQRGSRPYAERVQRIRLAAAQLNMVVGDLDGNVERILAAMKAAEADDADLVAFPELAITGYPPRICCSSRGSSPTTAMPSTRVVARAAAGALPFVGFVDRDERGLYNAVSGVRERRVARRLPQASAAELRGVRRAPLLPPWAPTRWQLYEIAGLPVGVSICEDAWCPGGPSSSRPRAVLELIVNINGSPYHAGKVEAREAMLARRADEACCTILYINLVGGQDELVFDGASLVISPNGTIITRAGQYTEELFVTDVELDVTGPRLHAADRRRDRRWPIARQAPVTGRTRNRALPSAGEVYGALVLGTRDYVRKNGFTDVVLGLVRRDRLVAGGRHRGRRARRLSTYTAC